LEKKKSAQEKTEKFYQECAEREKLQKAHSYPGKLRRGRSVGPGSDFWKKKKASIGFDPREKWASP